MAAKVQKCEGTPPTAEEVEAWFRDRDLPPRAWGNQPGDTYGWHAHDYRKVLFCVSGSIVFHTEEGDHELHAGDRLDVEPHTEHAATVGPEGVQCVEAAA